MPLVASILIWLALAVLAGLVLVTATPLRLELRLTKAEGWDGQAALRPLGRFGPRIPLRRDANSRKHADKPKRKRTRRKTHRKSRPFRPQIVSAAGRLIPDLLSKIRFDQFDVDMRFGLSDPADTGQIFGLMAPFIYGSAPASKRHVNIQPAFDGPVLEGRAALDLSVVPVTLLPPLIRFGWTAFGPTR